MKKNIGYILIIALFMGGCSSVQKRDDNDEIKIEKNEKENVLDTKSIETKYSLEETDTSKPFIESKKLTLKNNILDKKVKDFAEGTKRATYTEYYKNYGRKKKNIKKVVTYDENGSFLSSLTYYNNKENSLRTKELKKDGVIEFEMFDKNGKTIEEKSFDMRKNEDLKLYYDMKEEYEF